MRLSASDWGKYVEKLSRINAEAGKQMQAFIDRNGTDDTSALVRYAYALATKYGEASGSLACEMYDAIAEKSGKRVEAAEMAETATYQETARAVQGTMINRRNSVPQTVERLVKQTSADTMLKNALRDGAKFAWIPHGDTCAFCIAIASRGWQYMSKSALKNGHAEHIHANCDCEYVISFDANPKVEGYDPKQYQEIYDNADGGNAKAKINAIRRMQYAQVKAAENAPKIPRFTPAKSIDEAEKFASQFISGGYKSVVSYKGVDLEYANEFNRAFNDVLSQYDPKYKLRSIQPFNMREKRFKGTTSDAAYQWGMHDLFFNKGYYKSAKDFKKHLDQAEDLLKQVLPHVDDLIEKNRGNTSFTARLQTRYMEALKLTKKGNVKMDPYSVMVHELGHYLDDQVFRSNMKSNGFNLSESFEKYSRGISAYATENTQEYVAESFLSYWIGETKNVDPNLIKIFKESRK